MATAQLEELSQRQAKLLDALAPQHLLQLLEDAVSAVRGQWLCRSRCTCMPSRQLMLHARLLVGQ